MTVVSGFTTAKFQSTLSVRRATCDDRGVCVADLKFQSTLSVRRATDMVIPPDYVQDISIHALREESDFH